MTTKKTASKSTASKKAGGASARREAKSARTTPNGKAEAKAKPTKAPAKTAAPKEAKRSAEKAAAPAKPAEEARRRATPAEAKEPAASEATGRPRGTSALAQQILESDAPAPQIAELGVALLDGTSTRATNAARVVADIAEAKIEAVVPLVDKFVKTIASKNKRVVQTAADALPNVARIAPARVARHLELLKTSFAQSSPVGKDGLVRTFAALCTASVAYQKRLEPVLTYALGEADGKMLLRWSQIVLPALKGEPHARARAVVESRLERIPRAYAQQIADFLGIKLRARYR
jgi:hypothetical protein